MLGGVLLGLIASFLIRIPLSVGAGRSGRKAQKAIERQVAQHADARVVEPVARVIDDRRTLDELRRSVAG
jgi:hypothetical protein